VWNQARLNVCANVSLHTQEPLVACLGLAHLWVTLTRAVLGEVGRCDERGINYCTSFEQQAPVDQLGVNGGRNLRGLFHGWISQAKPLPHKMAAKDYGNGKRWAVRFTYRRKGMDQASQLNPRHNKIHLFKKFTLSHSLGDQFKFGGGKRGLFLKHITLKSSVTMTFAALP
jgi:hypothetical protein